MNHILLLNFSCAHGDESSLPPNMLNLPATFYPINFTAHVYFSLDRQFLASSFQFIYF